MRKNHKQMSNESRCRKVTELMNWSFGDLFDAKQRYWEAYKALHSEVIYEKYSIVEEAIACKKGNDEQAWDFLS